MILGNKKLKATTGFVIVESEEHERSETVLKSGIILCHKEEHNIWVKGVVHSAGKVALYNNEHKIISVSDTAIINEGDEILYRKYEGQRIAFTDRIFYRLPYERVRIVVSDRTKSEISDS